MFYENFRFNDNRSDVRRSLDLRLWPLSAALMAAAGLKWLGHVDLPALLLPLASVWWLVLLATRLVLPALHSERAFYRGHIAFYLFEAVFLGLFAWLSGGIEWIGFVGFIFMVVYGAFLLQKREGLMVTLLAALVYGIVLLAEYRGLLDHQSLFPDGLAATDPSYLIPTYLCTAAALVFLGLTASRFAEVLRQRNLQVKAANQRLHDLNGAMASSNIRLAASEKTLLQTNARLSQQNDDLLKSQNVLLTLATAVETKDNYTHGHSMRVARYAVALATELGLGHEDVQCIKNGSLLHDLGKINVSDLILRKAGALTDVEYAAIQAHPATGEKIISTLAYCKPYLDIVRHHHERVDGKGYPDRLKGDEISLHARIVAIADTFDAMTSDRPYRKGLSQNEAFATFREYAGLQWDKRLVFVFIEMMDRRGSKGLEEFHLDASGLLLDFQDRPTWV